MPKATKKLQKKVIHQDINPDLHSTPDQLAVKYYNWAWNLGISYARKHIPNYVDPDYIAGLAISGLGDAIKNYKPEKNKFSYYASRRIIGHIKDELRKLEFFHRRNQPYPKTVFFSQISDSNSTESGEEVNIVNIIVDHGVYPEKYETEFKLENHDIKIKFENLARKYLEGIVLHWVLCCMLGGIQQNELAKQLNLSESRIAQLRRHPSIIIFISNLQKELPELWE